MVAVEAVYGKNAGIVWRALNEKGQLGLRELSKFTKLSMLDVNGALGWLGRENKIRIVEKGNKVVYELNGR
ncbi:MAG: winged helix-turn-helix domain-containing protein [Candidatus Aenigmatarchaeota archaeon]